MDIYNKKYNYAQVKAICEVFKYDELDLDYESIINIALGYYDEWVKLNNLKKQGKVAETKNKQGKPISFKDTSEFAYEQAYFDRRVREDFNLKYRGLL